LDSDEPTTRLQGALDMLILKSLVAGETHGLGISRRIQQVTGSTFTVKPGSLFPALHRMEEEGWIPSLGGASDNNRRAKYFRLTKPGQKQLEVETKRWDGISWAIAQALEAS
jgi:PadR family transcriptional regulator, regulatory protein PadR